MTKSNAESGHGGVPIFVDEDGAEVMAPPSEAVADCAQFEQTDAGNAKRLARHSEGRLLAVTGNGWAAWDGTRFAADDAEATAATRLALAVAEAIKDECECLRSEGASDDTLKSRYSHHLRSQNRARIEALMKLARPELATDPASLDADPDLLNTPAGTIHLPSGEVRPHDPADLLTRSTAVAPDTAAGAPHWLAHLERCLPDPQLRDYFKRVCGYSLTGRTEEQVFVTLVGPGATGKSTTMKALGRLMGDYWTPAAAETFMQSRRGGGESRSDLVRLRGRRLVTMSEATDGLRFDERLLKEQTGGEPITARGLYASEITFLPSFKLWIGCNALPIFDGADSAMRRRLRVIPFDVPIPASERDGRLAAKLERELPGILAWALEGAREWYASGLGSCAAVEAASTASWQAADPVGQFIEDVCVRDPEAVTPVAELAAAFGDWAEENRQPEFGATRLGSAFTKHGFPAARATVEGKRVRVRAGLRIASGTGWDGSSRESPVGADLKSPGRTRPVPSQPLEQADSADDEFSLASPEIELEVDRLVAKFGGGL